MNDIDKMPVKCRDCPYWELASYSWCCEDCVDKMNPKNSEYIKRIDAKKALTALPPDLDAETVQRCVEAMNNPKAADVEPVRHGRWVSKEGIYGVVYCSICDFELKIDNTPRCPKCGAKMQGEDGND